MAVNTVLRHLFIPHHSNNHHARILHVDAMVFYLLAFLVFRFFLQNIPIHFPGVLGYATDIHVNELFAGTNKKRMESGLTPLVLDTRLSKAAADKAKHMFTNDYWAHFGPVGTAPWEFILTEGYQYRIAGENLAKNFSNSHAVVDAWMASSTHRDNIMRADYKDIGFAIVNGVLGGEETTLVVQMFGAGDSQLAYQVKPTEVTPSAASTVLASVHSQSNNNGWTDVFVRPLIDITGLSKNVTMGFTGLILFVVALDGWYVYRKKIVRVAGHSAGHAAFLTIMLLVLQVASRGVTL